MMLLIGSNILMKKSDIREGIFVRLIETKEKITIKKIENNTDKSAVSRCQFGAKNLCK